jgi:hypothetical protein
MHNPQCTQGCKNSVTVCCSCCSRCCLAAHLLRIVFVPWFIRALLQIVVKCVTPLRVREVANITEQAQACLASIVPVPLHHLSQPEPTSKEQTLAPLSLVLAAPGLFATMRLRPGANIVLLAGARTLLVLLCTREYAPLACYDHTIQKRPALIRTRKSTWIGLHQYWGERSPGNPQCRSVLPAWATLCHGWRTRITTLEGMGMHCCYTDCKLAKF